MAISNFLNPEEEVEVEKEDEADDDEEEQPEEPVYSIQEARKAMQVLIKFTEGSAELHTAHLRAIERLEL
ncbi:hypothetical protein GMDG_06863 [Pseudogymnoascus destructans 20631-21]|uniref:Uncharacterized protein n=1 Tax=Pseudogymnoascus destructans (strain ATCC MYA-4855 / 20631-21) TaxID=658429 RepID=L8FVQ5_PSED2|nr:hypothetical protein GMDG_06863 [Pseudogymnoascus destructans 20631-21]